MAEEIRKDIILSVKADTSDAGQKVDELGAKVKKVGDEKIEAPFKNFKQQIKEATLEAQKLEQQFGRNSAQFRDAVQRVAELKDSYQEFGQTVQAFNPDNKLQALSQAGNAAVVALQGVTGALQLVGVEGEDSRAIVEKLQGALNFVQALGSIDDLKNGFKSLALVLGLTRTAKQADAAATATQTAAQKGLTVATEASIFSLKTFKTALATTGIGLLVVGLGFLIQKLFETKDANEQLTKSEEDLAAAVAQVNGVFNQQILDLDRATEKRIKNLKIQGKSEKEILDAQLAGLEETRRLRQRQISELIAAGGTPEEVAKLTAENIKNIQQQEDLILEFELKQADKKREALKKDKNKDKKEKKKEFEEDEAQRKENEQLFRENELKRLDERARIIREFELKQEDLNKKFLEKKIRQDTLLQGTQAIRLERERQLEEFDAEQKKNKDEEDAKRREENLKKDKEFRDALLEQAKKQAEEERIIEEERLNFKRTIIDAGANLLNVAAGFAEQGSDIQKAFAIAGVLAEKGKTIFDIITNTIKQNTLITTQTQALNAQAALLPFPLNVGKIAANEAIGVARKKRNTTTAIVNSGIVTAQAALAIANISKAGKGGGGGGGGNVGNIGTGGGGGDIQTTAPTITSTQTAPQAVQDVRVTNQTGAPLRAYITDRDLRTNEQRTRFLNSLSNF
jgi:hypothetical protein